MNVNLSKSENNICVYLAQGLTNKEIADRLFVEEKTVKFHLYNIYKKMNVSNRAQAILKLNNLHSDQYEEIKKEYKVEDGFTPRPATILPYKDNPKGLAPAPRPAMTQVEKVQFIDQHFKVGEAISHMHHLMKEVTKEKIDQNTVNAACNCIARVNETINTAIQASRFLNER